MGPSCDICGGELMIDAGGKSATCQVCGTKHTIERVREKMGFQNPPAPQVPEPPKPAPQPPKPQAEVQKPAPKAPAAQAGAQIPAAPPAPKDPVSAKGPEDRPGNVLFEMTVKFALSMSFGECCVTGRVESGLARVGERYLLRVRQGFWVGAAIRSISRDGDELRSAGAGTEAVIQFSPSSKGVGLTKHIEKSGSFAAFPADFSVGGKQITLRSLYGVSGLGAVASCCADDVFASLRDGPYRLTSPCGAVEKAALLTPASLPDHAVQGTLIVMCPDAALLPGSGLEPAPDEEFAPPEGFQMAVTSAGVPGVCAQGVVVSGTVRSGDTLNFTDASGAKAQARASEITTLSNQPLVKPVRGEWLKLRLTGVKSSQLPVGGVLSAVIESPAPGVPASPGADAASSCFELEVEKSKKLSPSSCTLSVRILSGTLREKGHYLIGPKGKSLTAFTLSDIFSNGSPWTSVGPGTRASLTFTNPVQSVSDLMGADRIWGMGAELAFTDRDTGAPALRINADMMSFLPGWGVRLSGLVVSGIPRAMTCWQVPLPRGKSRLITIYSAFSGEQDRLPREGKRCTLLIEGAEDEDLACAPIVSVPGAARVQKDPGVRLYVGELTGITQSFSATVLSGEPKVGTHIPVKDAVTGNTVDAVIRYLFNPGHQNAPSRPGDYVLLTLSGIRKSRLKPFSFIPSKPGPTVKPSVPAAVSEPPEKEPINPAPAAPKPPVPKSEPASPEPAPEAPKSAAADPPAPKPTDPKPAAADSSAPKPVQEVLDAIFELVEIGLPQLPQIFSMPAAPVFTPPPDPAPQPPANPVREALDAAGRLISASDTQSAKSDAAKLEALYPQLAASASSGGAPEAGAAAICAHALAVYYADIDFDRPSLDRWSKAGLSHLRSLTGAALDPQERSSYKGMKQTLTEHQGYVAFLEKRYSDCIQTLKTCAMTPQVLGMSAISFTRLAIDGDNGQPALVAMNLFRNMDRAITRPAKPGTYVEDVYRNAYTFYAMLLAYGGSTFPGFGLTDDLPGAVAALKRGISFVKDEVYIKWLREAIDKYTSEMGG